MNISEAAYKVYQLIVNELTERFGQVGYVVTEEKENDPVYQSHYTVWSNNVDILRLSWDGKENLFMLEVSTDLPVSALSQWDTISLIPFNPAYENADYLFQTAKKVVDSLN